MKELDYGKMGMRIRQARKTKAGRRRSSQRSVASACHSLGISSGDQDHEIWADIINEA